MPLIACPACTSPVSTAAAACPKCAHPITIAPPFQKTPLTIEQTSKKYKALQLAGVILMIIATLMLVANKGHGNGVLVAGVGLAVYIYGRVSAWWQNG